MTATRDQGRQLLEQLRAVRTTFGAGAARRKADLLARLADVSLDAPRLLRTYHDTLLFLVAYPDDPHVHGLGQRELARAAAAARRLAGSRRGARALLDTGIAGTTIESSFSATVVEWLVRRFPGAADIAWEGDSAGAALDERLSTLVARVETDGLLAGGLSTRAWLQLAGGDGRTALEWIVQQVRRRNDAADAADHLFEELDLSVRFTVPDEASSTFTRFPSRAVCHHPRALRRTVSLRKAIARPVPDATPLPRAAARRIIDTTRASLVIRHRETDPVTHASDREVTLFRLERGVDVATIGMTPDRRLPIESFFGYLAAKNGVPVAYGGGWVFLDRAEIGVNVFDPFRGGESAYLFGQILRVYHHHYRIRRFVIDPFQIGADNDDGIRSGAFWFYYRLGFRPTDPALRRLARTEHLANRADRARRTPNATLRHFATGTLAIDLVKGGQEPNLIHVGLAVTSAIGAQFDGDRERAARWARRRLADLAVKPGPRSTPEQRGAFDRLAVLFALIPDLGDWPATDRRDLAVIMRAKGGHRERDYARRLQDHARLREALSRLARTGETLTAT